MQNQLNDDMKAAMKAKDKLRLSAIRMLRAAVKEKEIELGRGLDESECIAVFSRLLKQRRDAAGQYADAGRPDLQEKELAEAEIIQAYLPEQLGDDELAAMVSRAIADTSAAGMRDMGKVMAAVREKAQGRADMGKLSALVKASLTSLG